MEWNLGEGVSKRGGTYIFANCWLGSTSMENEDRYEALGLGASDPLINVTF
jgi:hypothetical protein